VGGILVVAGVIALGLGYGLWTGKGWAWTLALIFSILGILGGIISLPEGVVSIIIDILIIYYLTRAHVKQFFGK